MNPDVLTGKRKLRPFKRSVVVSPLTQFHRNLTELLR